MNMSTSGHLHDIELAAVAPADRFAYWNDVICALFIPSSNKRSEIDMDFTARLSRRTLGPVDVSLIEASPICSVRDADLVRRQPMEDLVVTFLVEGEGRLEQCGRAAVQRTGDLIMYDGARPFTYEFSGPYRGYFTRISRAFVKQAVPRPEELTAIPVRADAPLASLAAGALRNSCQLDPAIDPGIAARVGASLADLMTAALQVSLPSRARPSRHASTLARIKRKMEERLDDPELCIEELARELGLSHRTLNRLFASDGTTAVRWLWSRRLERSRGSLAEGRARSVTEVALSCGFSDVSHFSRAFRRTYGVSPRSLLRQI
jgi:AraC-like DNA-binding protein